MAEIDLRDLGAALVLLRKIHDWTQENLADASGVPASSVCEYEGGIVRPSDRNLRRMMAALRFPFALLAGLLALIRAVRQVTTAFDAIRNDRLPRALADVARRTGNAAEAFLKAAFDLILTPTAVHQPSPEDRVAAPALWARLEPYSHTERLCLVRMGETFRSWALAELLCSESVRAAADDSRAAIEFAELAVEIARVVPGPERWRSHMEGFALPFLGNARRANGDLPSAQEAFACSYEAWPEGIVCEHGLLDDSRRLDLEASLLRCQRRLPEALVLLDRAVSACQERSIGRILVMRAKVLEEMGEYERALATLREAATLVDGADDHLLFALRFNELVNLCFLKRHSEAEPMLGSLRELAERLPNGLRRLRLRWLEGRIAAGVGRTAEGIAALREVCAELIEREIAFDAALATLELAGLLAAQGRTAEVKALAAQTARIFAAQGVERERLGALTLFCRAAEEERLTVDLARQLLLDLKQAAGGTCDSETSARRRRPPASRS